MSHIFEQVIQVEQQHIDQLGHVNNVVYISWLQQVAIAHTVALGLAIDDFLRLNHAMVASEHHVKYKKPCFLADEVVLRTWLGELSAYSSIRHYLFYRKKDGVTVFQGYTQWVCVEITTGKLKRLSPTFIQAYQPLDTTIDPFLTHY